MTRSQYVAVLVILLAGGAFLAVNLLSTDDADDTALQSTDSAGAGDTAAAPEAAAPTTTTTVLDEAPPILDDVPGVLIDLDGWLQTDATSFSDFDGTVRVVQFWTFGCINCKNTLDNLSTLYATYQPKGLEVIGVHSPEFDFEKDVDSIQQAAIDLDVTWPIALDTDKTNFRSWQTGRRFWPRTFVLDQNGKVRFDRIGEGAYDELNATVAYLIENGP